MTGFVPYTLGCKLKNILNSVAYALQCIGILSGTLWVVGITATELSLTNTKVCINIFLIGDFVFEFNQACRPVEKNESHQKKASTMKH